MQAAMQPRAEPDQRPAAPAPAAPEGAAAAAAAGSSSSGATTTTTNNDDDKAVTTDTNTVQPSSAPPLASSSGTSTRAPGSAPASRPIAAADAAGDAYEQAHVHAVYEQIAAHFSATRHKPWPVVAGFLRGRPAGQVGLDVGCGNGKYLAVNPDVVVLGSDRSANLVAIARELWCGGGGAGAGLDVAVADGLDLPYARGRVDFAICIAVLHHLSTPPRRVAGVQALLECLRPGGEALLYVWALEQRGSRRGWDEGSEQDQLVPWVMKTQQKKGEKEGPGTTYERYYHLYRKGELEGDVLAAGGTVVESGYDRDNWWVVARREA
ncbi:S-adenosyl-L-methionine-dependent methyltransferase [Xylariomycetidae sp. FL0641]|nr:S-adenosyl-L-methionine-dependent methyltransferase [Xylariomycetidae sp. FL0641]